MEIKDILKQRRLEKQLTLDDVARLVGVSAATISRWESGDIANMKRDKIVNLAKALDISPAVIMEWDEPDMTLVSQQSADPDIRRIERARKNMPETDKKFMMDMLTRSFSEYFKDDGSDDPD
ncbi:MAG: helix-turn-helix transcriptional regulator [Lachnospiraceae bacterium]